MPPRRFTRRAGAQQFRAALRRILGRAFSRKPLAGGSRLWAPILFGRIVSSDKRPYRFGAAEATSPRAACVIAHAFCRRPYFAILVTSADGLWAEPIGSSGARHAASPILLVRGLGRDAIVRLPTMRA